MRIKLIAPWLIVFLGIVTASAGDNSLGTWKLNVEKSKYTPPPFPVKSLTTTREASDGGVKVTATGEREDGTPIKSGYAAKYDGKDNPVTGAPWDTIAIKQVDDNTFTVTTKQASGKYRATGRVVVSKDGKTMTATSKGTDSEGVAFTSEFVWEKQ
jgi:hypothetical protein